MKIEGIKNECEEVKKMRESSEFQVSLMQEAF
jgi:hypothetical protein